MSTENYGVYLTPHFEKYQAQDEATADGMQATWNFGNKLKFKGYKLAYMHGSVGLYEGMVLQAFEYVFKSKDHVDDFISTWPADTNVYFLFRKHKKTLQLAVLDKEVIKQNREKNKEELKPRRKSVERSKHDSEKDKS